MLSGTPAVVCLGILGLVDENLLEMAEGQDVVSDEDASRVLASHTEEMIRQLSN